MTRRQAIAILGVILLLGAGGALVYAWGVQKRAPASEEKAYVNAAYGIAFDYTGDYDLTEREAGSAERYHYSIALTQAIAAVPEGGEGPTAITVDIFQNDIERQNVEDWIRNTSASNVKLGDGALTSVMVDGQEALSYSWDGLYRGDSVVLAHRDNIIMLSVTYLDPADKIRGDFEVFVDSFELYDVDEPLPPQADRLPEARNESSQPAACTMDARLCPDGSYVGRVPPSCEFAACPGIETSGTIEARIDQGSSALEVKVVPLAVVEDSRCPIDAICIQAGTVRVRAQVMSGTSSSVEVFALNEPVSVQGKTVTLVAVTPSAMASREIPLSEYVFTFTVTQP